MKCGIRKSLFVFGIATLFVFSGCSGKTVSSAQPAVSSEALSPSSQASRTELVISAAASLTDVMNELKKVYESENGSVTITPTYASSGTLQTQIEEGAPSDIFFSAAQKQMKALESKGLIQSDTKKDLLLNKIVLIVPKGKANGISAFTDAATDRVGKIALGEPKSVPAGQYAEKVFTSLKILDQVKKKAVYGSDVRQVLTWVESGSVDCGVVYATDAATSDEVDTIAEAPEGSTDPIIYPVAVLKSSKNTEAAKAFIDFLSGDTAKTVFEKYGFTRNQ
ncbi:molybdate ABC transporter substrate-binding protein [Caproicibacter sp.]|uniref:molybdate ABC transporter substrate-binding protein n=1 Tax=Caproicibacter sp. TaxID=2814884 RepID=UPI0039898FCE